VPFDCGTHAFRIGSRQGPASIREQSRLVRAYESEVADFDIREALGLVDCGDVALTPGRIAEAFELIEEAAWRIVEAGATPIASAATARSRAADPRRRAQMAGALRAACRQPHRLPSGQPGASYDAASQFSHVALEQRVSPSTSWHVGMRGSTYRPGVLNHTRALGYNVITMRDYMRRGEDDVLAELHRTMKGRPVYLSWDIDSFDPSVAPGVCTPTWGGFTARKACSFCAASPGSTLSRSTSTPSARRTTSTEWPRTSRHRSLSTACSF